jgi:lipopolysaccharide transport system ATP-binding protein
LNTGKYFATIILVGKNFEIISQLDKVISIEMKEKGTNRGDYFGFWGGVVRPVLNWSNNKI